MKQSEISEEEVAKYWNKNAAVWTEQVRRGRDVYREYFNNPAFFKFIGDLKEKNVLDVGCGEGYNTRLLARWGAKVIGVDISPQMIELARQEEQRKSLGIRYEVASFSDLSIFEDESFEVVVSFMALMDSPQFDKSVKEIFRVLRNKGEFFFNITHPCFITKGHGWIKDEEGNYLKLTVSDYFSDRPWIAQWKFSKAPVPEEVKPFAVPSFPKTLSSYLNELIEVGFVLKRIKEPRPSKKMCKKHPWLQRWRDHAAIFLYVHTVKP